MGSLKRWMDKHWMDGWMDGLMEYEKIGTSPLGTSHSVSLKNLWASVIAAERQFS